MTRYLFIALFAMTLHNNSSGQTLDRYADQLYFGMLSFNPDTSIKEFLTKYIPVVFKKFDSIGGWTVYPPGVIEEPKFYKVTHSYVFNNHPYFSGNYKSGQLAITEKIYIDKKWNENITDIKLWFEFDVEDEARESFKQLIDTFSNFNVLKRITTQQGMDKAEFTDKNCDSYYSHIQIILVPDYTLGKRYVMPTENEIKIHTEAGYKILIGVGNDLY
jgi:cytochrome oxidase Cu insertion factor (SCO1/SenC/PrrC family)